MRRYFYSHILTHVEDSCGRRLPFSSGATHQSFTREGLRGGGGPRCYAGRDGRLAYRARCHCPRYKHARWLSIDVLKRLKRSTKTQRIPVVVVSGSGESDIRQIALDIGVADFLTKPVDLDQLCRTLSSLMPVLLRRSTTHASETAKALVWRLNLQRRVFSNKTG